MLALPSHDLYQRYKLGTNHVVDRIVQTAPDTGGLHKEYVSTLKAFKTGKKIWNKNKHGLPQSQEPSAQKISTQSLEQLSLQMQRPRWRRKRRIRASVIRSLFSRACCKAGVNAQAGTSGILTGNPLRIEATFTSSMCSRE